ncbi:MlaA family lipoprotein [Sphingomonas nostoxanthinifaciens]|uniref:MlaA family lipoprotein n=1 Tax=Sphingomonas nostoxanthinifaciens TaxID=2872652 RepID=UPI0021DB1C0B|nr:VacJ family lipoprotein [Sphingomonas nostoxanthinifaciens]UAK24129.1 VacJ family lipoprotein [Sphingomonas nostoxanthinifaciens]
MMVYSRALRAAVSLAALTLVSACATTPGQDRLAERDPLEKLNRKIWGVDMFADRILIKPVAKGYRSVTPQPARQGLTNFFSNVTEPWSFVNNLLQGKPARAGRNLKRFVVNTTIGVGGLFDHASKIGITPAQEDLGQTMAVWGFNGGPYLVLPLLGPSTMRDGIGAAAAAYGDPVNVAINQWDINVWYKRGYRAVQIVSARSDLIESGGDAFLQSSLDPYAAARSAFLQRRRAQIMDQEDAGGAPDETPTTGEPVATPIGGADAVPPPGGESAAPMPGDAPAAAPSKPADQALPESAAPMPGDAPAPATPPKPGDKPRP